MRTALMALGTLIVASVYCGKGNAQIASHQHGVATLRLIQDGFDIYVEFESPGADILGFEHEPQTPEQVQALALARQQFESIDTLLLSEADCETVQHRLLTAGYDAATDEHAHDDHHGHAHAGFTASYRLTCSSEGFSTTVDIQLFRHFETIEQLNIEWFTAAGQGAQRLDRGGNSRLVL